MKTIWKFIAPRPGTLRAWQLAVLLLVFGLWHALTKPGLIPPFVFDNDRQAAFFFGEPLVIFGRIWGWFVVNADIYQHLWVTLVETVLAFGIGTALGLVCGLWLALSPMAAAILDPYIKALNSMPRMKLFCVISDLDIQNIAPRPARGSATDPTRPAGEGSVPVALPPGLPFMPPPGAGTV